MKRSILSIAPILLLLISCSPILTSERIPHTATAYFKIHKGFNANSQHHDYLSPRAGLLATSTQNGPNPTDLAQLGEHTQVALEGTSLFSVFLKPKELQAKLTQNRQLAAKATQYLSTLNTVTISDKDLVNPIGQYFKIDNLFVFYVSSWPCQSCKNLKKIRLKLRLIDAPSGLILWNGTIEQNIDADDSPLEVAKSLSADLIQIFKEKFQLKWHKLRLSNLSKS